MSYWLKKQTNQDRIVEKMTESRIERVEKRIKGLKSIYNISCNDCFRWADDYQSLVDGYRRMESQYRHATQWWADEYEKLAIANAEKRDHIQELETKLEGLQKRVEDHLEKMKEDMVRAGNRYSSMKSQAREFGRKNIIIRDLQEDS